MAHRPDPARVEEARRYATRYRLIGDGVSEATADAWLAAWAAHAARAGIGPGTAYWDAGWRWIADQRERRARP